MRYTIVCLLILALSCSNASAKPVVSVGFNYYQPGYHNAPAPYYNNYYETPYPINYQYPYAAQGTHYAAGFNAFNVGVSALSLGTLLL